VSRETQNARIRERGERLHDEGPAPALQIVVIAVLLTASLFVDIGLFSVRCGASPAVFWTGLVIGFVLQVIAVGVPYVLSARFSTEPLKYHVRGIVIAGLCFIWSIPVLQHSILFADGIGHERGYRSVGEQCHAKFIP